MPAPTIKQRRAAKGRDALGWVRNASKDKRLRSYIGAHVYGVGLNKLGTVRDIFAGADGMTRAKVQHFNGEWWDWEPPVSTLEVV